MKRAAAPAAALAALLLLALVDARSTPKVYDCTGKDKCKDSKITCTGDCAVRCDGEASCQDMKFTGAAGKVARVFCSGEAACKHAHFENAEVCCMWHAYSGKDVCKDVSGGSHDKHFKSSSLCPVPTNSKTGARCPDWAKKDYTKSCTAPPPLSCAAGTMKMVSAGTEVCAPCREGEWQDLPMQTECKLCPHGSYQPSTSRVSCISCASGETTRKEGAAQKSLCVCRSWGDPPKKRNANGQCVQAQNPAPAPRPAPSPSLGPRQSPPAGSSGSAESAQQAAECQADSHRFNELLCKQLRQKLLLQEKQQREKAAVAALKLCSKRQLALDGEPRLVHIT